MRIDQAAFHSIATILAAHFDSLYYVEIESGKFLQFIPSKKTENVMFPDHGNDFFQLAQDNAYKFIHPRDLDAVLKMYDREYLRACLTEAPSCSVDCRGILNGTLTHMRHIVFRCADQKHVICCLENTEEEYQREEEQKRNLLTAERMARRDELTGIRNQNAFTEAVNEINSRINSAITSKNMTEPFGVVICDVNDLKRINDTRGHSFGDETIQRTSRMITNTFRHSPVFRIGGDEFAVVLTGRDYKDRDELVEAFRKESDVNKRTGSGPTVACGLAVYEPEQDRDFSAVFNRADLQMYENKAELKKQKAGGAKSRKEDIPIPEERIRLLDRMFGALYTVAGEGYIYLCDIPYDYSRWSMAQVEDFGLPSTYMYHAGDIWEQYVHPDDLEAYRKAVDEVINCNSEMSRMFYRVRKPDGTYVLFTARGFVLKDPDGNPEYFGGIMMPQ